MSRFKVQGFPTILVFGADKDSPIPYEGARTAAAIESFALEQLETNVAPPEVTEIHSPVSIFSPAYLVCIGLKKDYNKIMDLAKEECPKGTDCETYNLTCVCVLLNDFNYSQNHVLNDT